ncbi:Uncharacterised protein [Mycobacteroides abscessus subsp. abscessus]|nr:Uncharacterised protein [Mycobacteroides abscessus subsp. abscessus]
MPVNIWMYEAFVAQGEGQMISDDEKSAEFNGEAGVEALEFWKKMADKGVIKVPGGEAAAEVAKQDFANSRSAMASWPKNRALS